MDLGADIVDFVSKYSKFNSNMELISQNIYILNAIIEDTDDKTLKNACIDIKSQLSSSLDNVVLTALDFSKMLAGDITSIFADGIIAAIPVVGPYIAAAKLALDLGDFMFNVSDVSEACTYLYSISSCAHILSEDFDVSVYKKLNDYDRDKKIVSGIDQIINSRNKLNNLVVMRIESENKMKDADKANSFLIEWLFTDVMYKISDIDANINKLEPLKIKYMYY